MDDTRVRLGATGSATAITKTVACDFSLANDGLRISEVRISTRTEDKLKAFVSITLNDALVVRGIKVIEGRQRLFVAMPSRPRPDGLFQDVVHPINQSTRTLLEGEILRIYKDVIETDDIG